MSRKSTRPRGPKLIRPVPFPAIPANEDPEFSALPSKVRSDIRVWLNRLKTIWDCAPMPMAQALRQLARRTRQPFKTTQKRYYALRRGGDWRSLINHRLLTTGMHAIRRVLPPSGLDIVVISSGPREVIVCVRPTKPKISNESGTAPEHLVSREP
jgi:hypothetical protein